MDNTARVWDAASGEALLSLQHDGSVLACQFSPDGRHVLTGSEDLTDLLWESLTGEEVVTFRHPYVV